VALSLSLLRYDDDLTVSSGTVTSGAAVTPSNNSLLIVVFMGAGESGGSGIANPTGYTVSGGSLSYTRRASTLSGDDHSDGFMSSVGFWTAPVTTGASTTVSVSGVTNGQRASLAIYQATGYNTSTPIGATGTAQFLGDDAISLSLSGTTATSSYIIGADAIQPSDVGGTAPTQGTGWTRDGWSSDPSPGWLFCSVQSRTGVAVSSVPWQDVIVGQTSYNQANAAIEILAAAGAAASLTPFRRPLRNYQRRF